MDSTNKQLAAEIKEALRKNRPKEALHYFKGTVCEDQAILLQARIGAFKDKKISIGSAEEKDWNMILANILELADKLGEEDSEPLKGGGEKRRERKDDKRSHELGGVHHLYCNREDQADNFEEGHNTVWLTDSCPFLFCTLYGAPRQSHKGLIKRLLHQHVVRNKETASLVAKQIALRPNYDVHSLKTFFLNELWKQTQGGRPENRENINSLLKAFQKTEKKEWVFRVYVKSAYWKSDFVEFLRWFTLEFCQNASAMEQIQPSQVRLYFFFMVVIEESEESSGFLSRLRKRASAKVDIEQEIIEAMESLKIPYYTCLPELHSITYNMLDDWMEEYVPEFSHTRKEELLEKHFPEGSKKRVRDGNCGKTPQADSQPL